MGVIINYGFTSSTTWILKPGLNELAPAACTQWTALQPALSGQPYSLHSVDSPAACTQWTALQLPLALPYSQTLKRA